MTTEPATAARPRGARFDPSSSEARWRATWEADGLDVFVYFDNDAKVHAPFDAIALQERLGISPPADEHHAGSSDREHRR